MWINGTPHLSPVGPQKDTVIQENKAKVPENAELRVASGLRNSIPRYTSPQTHEGTRACTQQPPVLVAPLLAITHSPTALVEPITDNCIDTLWPIGETDHGLTI